MYLIDYDKLRCVPMSILNLVLAMLCSPKLVIYRVVYTINWNFKYEMAFLPFFIYPARSYFFFFILPVCFLSGTPMLKRQRRR